MNFVFYDLETTGISPEFDQPLQFAAIRTDENLAELDRINIRCRLAPHILPSPHALVVTGVSPDQLIDPALPSLLDFAQRIADLTVDWSPAIWVGYNTMKFDEEVLRQTFYQNLLPDIYATQLNGNTRLDILPVIYAVHARAPGLMAWPMGDNGRPTFRLDRLAPANGFSAHHAHDALGDVKATIHLARQVARGNPALWSEVLENAHKARVQARLESFRPHELVTRFGAAEPRSWVGCFCGYLDGSGSRAAFFDLNAADPGDLMAASDEVLFAAVDASPKIIRSLATSKAPMLLTIAEHDPEHLRRAALIAGAPHFRQRVAQAMAARYVDDPDAAPKPVEQQIHGSFYSNADRRLLQEFRLSDWGRRQEIVATLSDPRLRQLGRRLIACHKPELLTPQEAEAFRAYLREKWHADAPQPGWMTLPKVRAALEDLRAKGAADSATLDAIAAFLQSRAGAPI